MLETTTRRPRPRRPVARKRRRGSIALLVVLLLLISAVAGVIGFYRWATGADGPQRPVAVAVPRGATGSEVATLLEDRNVVRSAFALRVVARLRGVPLEVKAGSYSMRTNMRPDDALAVLRNGPQAEQGVRVTFPEGFTVAQAAARAEEALGMDAETFVAAAKPSRFSPQTFLPDGSAPPEGYDTLEGFLFPDTYEFRSTVSADDVVGRLLEEFRRETSGLDWSGAGALGDDGLTAYEVVNVASMIEEEARIDDERPLISAVIDNRLKIGMTLGIDATIRYAVGKPSEPLTDEDLEIDSPYNTRKYPGLPPTPIASPGLASIRAALQPADVDYLYYVLKDCAGHHAFTNSYEEFLVLKEQQPTDC